MRVIFALAVTLGGIVAHTYPAGGAAFSFTTIDVAGAVNTQANGINDAGQIVGFFSNATGAHGFLYAGGSSTIIDFPGTFTGTSANGINNEAQIVGTIPVGTGHDTLTQGFLDTGGSFSAVNKPGALHTNPDGINGAGQIVGFFSTQLGEFPTHGFLDTAGSFATIDVPGAIGIGTQALGINGAGLIVGNFSDGTAVHGFLDAGGSFTTIDVPGAFETIANSINDAGQIAGFFTDNSGEHGFVDTGGSFTTIDVPGALFTEPHGINDAGLIVGRFGLDGFDHVFLATPVSAVPEPSTLALLSVGAIGLGILRNRKRAGQSAREG